MTARIEGFEFLVGGRWVRCWGSGGPLGGGAIHAVHIGAVEVAKVCEQLRLRALALGFRAKACRAVHAPQHGSDEAPRESAVGDECGGKA